MTAEVQWCLDNTDSNKHGTESVYNMPKDPVHHGMGFGTHQTCFAYILKFEIEICIFLMPINAIFLQTKLLKDKQTK